MAASCAQRVRTVGILLFRGFEPLDVFGPLEAFVIAEHVPHSRSISSLRQVSATNCPTKIQALEPLQRGTASSSPQSAADDKPFRVVTIAESLDPVAMNGGVCVVPQHTTTDYPPLSVLLVPGGYGIRTEYKNEKLVEFVRSNAVNLPRPSPLVLGGPEGTPGAPDGTKTEWNGKDLEVIASVCTGASLLAVAGVLAGVHVATTNRRAIDWVTSVSPPHIPWSERHRFADCGSVVTSAGISAGTDMALHLVRRMVGFESAKVAARRMEYTWNFDHMDSEFATTNAV